MSVKPQGDVQIQPSSCGSSGGIINVTSGCVISPRFTSSTRSSAGGVFKSGCTSLTSRDLEVPTLKIDSRAESAKLKPHGGRHTHRDNSRNEEVTMTVDDSYTTFVADCEF